ncbi:hypothetical protein M514_02493 [Trichuris suis]|uniref:SET domain-containing protein n=1 Tax=Trichuris suis TaxID=68888 RepID=A0A085MQN1_9BILA|nr:hypothetical protein M513_02493 [Trichuris suis]KFD59527.1 hypothetical protein M514_02493 [Trichuris suis]
MQCISKMIQLCDDISNGKEAVPVSLFAPSSAYALPEFTYTTSVLIRKESCLPSRFRKGCNCDADCLFNDNCSCKNVSIDSILMCKNGGVTETSSDRLSTSTYISECHESCTCSRNCDNKATQSPLTFQFHVRHCGGKGWGLFASEYIPAKSFLFHYAGKFVQDREIVAEDTNDYVFMISAESEPSAYSFIDASSYGNLSRFVNHSCVPNCFAVRVRSGFEDRRFSRICFFSRQDIQPSEEITIDYSDSYWNYKGHAKCLCKQHECRYDKKD